jgi:hypothetical protein
MNLSVLHQNDLDTIFRYFPELRARVLSSISSILEKERNIASSRRSASKMNKHIADHNLSPECEVFLDHHQSAELQQSRQKQDWQFSDVHDFDRSPSNPYKDMQTQVLPFFEQKKWETHFSLPNDWDFGIEQNFSNYNESAANTRLPRSYIEDPTNEYDLMIRSFGIIQSPADFLQVSLPHVNASLPELVPLTTSSTLNSNNTPGASLLSRRHTTASASPLATRNQYFSALSVVNSEDELCPPENTEKIHASKSNISLEEQDTGVPQTWFKTETEGDSTRSISSDSSHSENEPKFLTPAATCEESIKYSRSEVLDEHQQFNP